VDRGCPRPRIATACAWRERRGRGRPYALGLAISRRL
jgi:hypothetical protein